MLCSWASLLRIIQVLLSVFTLSSAYYSLLEHKAHVFPCINVLELMRSIYIPCCPVKAVCVWVVVSAHTICSVINCDTFWPRQLFLLSYISYVNALAWLCWSFHGVIRKNLCFWFHIWSFVLNISLQLKRRKQKIETDPMYFLNTFFRSCCAQFCLSFWPFQLFVFHKIVCVECYKCHMWTRKKYVFLWYAPFNNCLKQQFWALARCLGGNWLICLSN